MASTPSVVKFIVDQLGPGASSKAMFGEYGVYLNGAIIGLICDNRLFLKPTTAVQAILKDPEMAPAYSGAKPSIVVPEESWEDHSLMARLAAETAAELSSKAPAKKRAPKASKPSTSTRTRRS